MTDRHVIKLTRANLDRAIQGVIAAVKQGGWVLELRPAKRTDDQNDALHGLIGQIMKQRTHHNGVRMTKELWKAAFMQALGEEIRFVPTLDGSGLFPIGLKTSALSKERFSDLMELVLAWTAREGLTIEHFGGEEAGGSNAARAA